MRFQVIVTALFCISILFLPACSGKKQEEAHLGEKGTAPRHEKDKHDEQGHDEGRHDTHDEMGLDKHDEEGHEGEVTLSEEAARVAGIRVEEVVPRPLATTMKLPARLAPDETRLARVNARATGRITNIHAVAGERVAAGKPLATLESREITDAIMEYRQAVIEKEGASLALDSTKQLFEVRGRHSMAEAKSSHAKAQAVLDTAKSNIERVRLLVEGKAVARKNLIEEEGRLAQADAEVERSRAELERAKAEYETGVALMPEVRHKERELANVESRRANALERLRLLGIDVTGKGVNGRLPLETTIAVQSPLSGTVIERSVSSGETVDPSKTLFTVADLSTLWVIAEVPENELSRLRKGQEAKVTLDAMPDESFATVIDHVYDILDPQTRRVRVRARLKNPGSFRPEMFATLTVSAGKTGMAPAVPASAVLREGEKAVVFVEEEPLTFRKTPVELGPVQGGYHRVVSGLKAGDRVVTAGAFTLKAEMEKGELGEGHAH